MNPFLFTARMKDLANELKFSFLSDSYAFLYKRPKMPQDSKAEDIKLDKITEWVYEKNNKYIQLSAARVDALYMLLKSQAKKSIEQFINEDLKIDKNLRMESYIKTYFEEGAYEMIAMMKEAGLAEVPILPIRPDRKSPEFIEVMDAIGNFFNKNRNVKNILFDILDT